MAANSKHYPPTSRLRRTRILNKSKGPQSKIFKQPQFCILHFDFYTKKALTIPIVSF